MSHHSRGWIALALGIGAILVWTLPASVAAHDKKASGRFQLTVGWGEEPAFTGARNSVVVAVSDNAGPLTESAGSLSVEVSFGTERITLPLEPAWGRPHEYRAWLVPTRAGTYTFHVTGKVKDQAIDVTSTCSESTFHCVADVSEIQFPAKDPSAGQLAERISRGLPRAELAADAAARAQRIAFAALATSGVGLVAAIAIGLRRGRKDV